MDIKYNSDEPTRIVILRISSEIADMYVATIAVLKQMVNEENIVDSIKHLDNTIVINGLQSALNMMEMDVETRKKLLGEIEKNEYNCRL